MGCFVCGMKPTWNGNPGEACSNSCFGSPSVHMGPMRQPQMDKGSLGPPLCVVCGVKPTWNGKPGEKCTKKCGAGSLPNSGANAPRRGAAREQLQQQPQKGPETSFNIPMSIACGRKLR